MIKEIQIISRNIKENIVRSLTGEVKTKIVKTPFGTFEVETKIHHFNKPFAECEKDCPKGWEIATYELLQYLRNNQPEEFNLIKTWEFCQNPDNISKKNNYVARFNADSDGANFICYWDPSYSSSSLGVRYFRRIK